MKRRNAILGITVGLLAIGAATWALREDQADVPTFRRVTVERGDVALTTLATGVVQPQNRLEVKPPIAGRMEKILVREGDRVGRGQILAWMSTLERAALLDAARAKGPAELAHWEDLYKPAPLPAPIAGMIIARNVEPGQSVATTDPIFVLSDRLIVKAQVDETDIGRIAIGQVATVTLDAYADSKVEARVDHVAFEAITVNNVTVYEVDVLPRAVPAFMRSGMTANVTFRIDERDGVLVLPAEAIEQDAKRAMVRVPRTGGERPESRPVETGLSDGDRTEIRSGLAEGDTVLVPVLRMPKSGSGRETSPLFSLGGRRGGGSGGGRSGGGR